jgi:hypothetical protein
MHCILKIFKGNIILIFIYQFPSTSKSSHKITTKRGQTKEEVFTVDTVTCTFQYVIGRETIELGFQNLKLI